MPCLMNRKLKKPPVLCVLLCADCFCILFVFSLISVTISDANSCQTAIMLECHTL